MIPDVLVVHHLSAILVACALCNASSVVVTFCICQYMYVSSSDSVLLPIRLVHVYAFTCNTVQLLTDFYVTLCLVIARVYC